MRSTLKFAVAAAAFAAAACGSTPSPGVTVTCSTAETILVTPGVAGIATVTQTYVIDDPGLGGTSVMNNTQFHVTSDSPEVTLCPGATCTPSKQDIDVTTDIHGIGKFTVAFSAAAPTPGAIIETFSGSASTCLVNY